MTRGRRERNGLELSGSDSRDRAGRVDQDLRVPLGVAERVERGGDPVEPDGAGDQRRRVDLAVRDQVQGLAELVRLVGEDEPQVDLLVDRHRRLERVRLHADAHHDDP